MSQIRLIYEQPRQLQNNATTFADIEQMLIRKKTFFCLFSHGVILHGVSASRIKNLLHVF